MRRLLSAALLIGQGGAATPPPLAPTSPWNVEYAAKECVVARPYGDPAHPIVVGFRPTPFGDNLRVLIVGNPAQLGEGRWVDLTLEAPGSTFDKMEFETRIHAPDGDRTVLGFYLGRAQFERLVGAAALTVRPANGPVVSVALGMNKSLLTALQKCEANLMAALGFDAKKIAAVATRAESENPDLWIDWKDYPSVSLNKAEEGRLLIAWNVTAAGRVTHCQVLETSGSKYLDEAACDAILRNARYRRPALDAAGNPVESYVTRRVNFRIPRRG